jgi:hypothetical protein
MNCNAFWSYQIVKEVIEILTLFQQEAIEAKVISLLAQPFQEAR